MKTKEEIKEWLLENCVDKYGVLNLSYLDFSDFDGTVSFSKIKVKNTLYQDSQEVGGYLYQDSQKVKYNLWQDNQIVERTLYQDSQKVKGVLIQNNQRFGKALYQQDTTDLIENKNDDNTIYYTNFKKEITLKELKAMGYVLKEEMNNG